MGSRGLVLLAVLAIASTTLGGNLALAAPAPSPTGSLTLTIEIHLTQKKGASGPWSIVPDTVNLVNGTTAVFDVRNEGTDVHTLMLGAPYDLVTPPLLPTQKATLGPIEANLTDGKTTLTVPFWCSIPGHKMLGMEGKIVINADPNATNASLPLGAKPAVGAPGAGPADSSLTLSVIGAAAVVVAAFVALPRLRARRRAAAAAPQVPPP